MIALKFLRAGRIGMFSGFQWPAPGTWVHAASDNADNVGEPPIACRRAIHACLATDLPWWLADELWRIELAGDVARERHKLVAPSGRLVQRVTGWSPGTAQAYGIACAWRARDHAGAALSRCGAEPVADRLRGCSTIDDLERSARACARSTPEHRIILTMAADAATRARTGPAATAAYIAAHTASRLDGATAYAHERSWQAQWLIEHMSLT